MFNVPQKFDGVSVLPASEFNSIVDELKNIITSAGQTLTGADVTQIAKSIANYVINGNFFTDSGVANAYLLGVVGAKLAPTNYVNGFTVVFKVGNSNTGASTVNIAGLGVKSIKKNNGADDLDSGDLVTGNIVELVYDLSGDYFELTRTEFVAADFLRRNVTNNITVGYTTTAFSLGNSGTGTLTPQIANGHIQTLTINGNFTLAAPTDTQSGVIEIQATVGSPGGFTINTSAYTVIEDSYDNTSGKVNIIRILKIGSTSYLSIKPVPIATVVEQTPYNAIINPQMLLSQRATSFTAVANGTYTLDRYRYGKSGVMVQNIIQDSDAPTVADANFLFTQSLAATVTTVDSSIGATDFAVIEQRIEGYRYIPLAQRTMTLSFWVKASLTGTYCVAFKNSGNDRSFVAEYTINSSNTWEKKTINIDASPAAGTWDYTNGTGLAVIFTLAAGSNFQAAAGSWQTGNYFATSNQINAVGTVGATFKITGLQLENGTAATPFLPRNIQQEMQDCMRYYQKSYPMATLPATITALGLRVEFTGGTSVLNGAAMASAELVQMRAAPTVTIYSPVSGVSGVVWNYNSPVSDVAIFVANLSERSFTINNDTGATLNNTIPGYQYTANSEL